jgi:hypothetical protein
VSGFDVWVANTDGVSFTREKRSGNYQCVEQNLSANHDGLGTNADLVLLYDDSAEILHSLLSEFSEYPTDDRESSCKTRFSILLKPLDLWLYSRFRSYGS